MKVGEPLNITIWDRCKPHPPNGILYSYATSGSSMTAVFHPPAEPARPHAIMCADAFRKVYHTVEEVVGFVGAETRGRMRALEEYDKMVGLGAR
jgi:hypothetical protein